MNGPPSEAAGCTSARKSQRSGQAGDTSAGRPQGGTVGEKLRGRLLDALNILKDAAQVQAEGAVGVREVVRFQGVHDGGVLLDQRCNRPRVQQAQASCAIEVRFGGVDRSPGGFVPCKPEDSRWNSSSRRKNSSTSPLASASLWL